MDKETFNAIAYASKVRATVFARDYRELRQPTQFTPRGVDWDIGSPCQCTACYLRLRVFEQFKQRYCFSFGPSYHHFPRM